MKKAVAILLLAVLVFNLIGYKCWFFIREIQSSQVATASVDGQHYEDSELITVKVPLALPYFTNWPAFEKYDGSVEIEGHHYNYVKRKLYNDTLVLLCLPNTTEDRLTEAKVSFEKLISDDGNQHNNKSASLPILVKLLNAVYFNAHYFYFTHPSFQRPSYPVINNRLVFKGIMSTPTQPPESYCRTHIFTWS